MLGLKLFRYITSDCDAVSIIYDEQGYVKEPEDAVADVLKAGTSAFYCYITLYPKFVLLLNKFLQEWTWTVVNI